MCQAVPCSNVGSVFLSDLGLARKRSSATVADRCSREKQRCCSATELQDERKRMQKRDVRPRNEEGAT